MIDFEIKSKTQPIGTRKGQTVYYAQPKSQQYFTNKMLIERIVRETSLSEGDVKNALISLSNVVCEAMQLGMSVDLAELGSFRVVVPSKMMDGQEGDNFRRHYHRPRQWQRRLIRIKRESRQPPRTPARRQLSMRF